MCEVARFEIFDRGNKASSLLPRRPDMKEGPAEAAAKAALYDMLFTCIGLLESRRAGCTGIIESIVVLQTPSCLGSALTPPWHDPTRSTEHSGQAVVLDFDA